MVGANDGACVGEVGADDVGALVVLVVFAVVVTVA